MKHLITILALVTVWLAGCVQLIDERPDGSKLKINSLFNTAGFDGLYREPDGFLEINTYKGIPSNLEIQYNPYTGVKLKTTKGK
jgi:hypothetical protein